jgi:hypothetical protein
VKTLPTLTPPKGTTKRPTPPKGEKSASPRHNLLSRHRLPLPSTTPAAVTLGWYVSGRTEQAIASRPFHPDPLPHLAPIESLWGVMHQNVTHNRCYARLCDFKAKTMMFLAQHVPRNWNALRDSVTDSVPRSGRRDYSTPISADCDPGWEVARLPWAAPQSIRNRVLPWCFRRESFDRNSGLEL